MTPDDIADPDGAVIDPAEEDLGADDFAEPSRRGRPRRRKIAAAIDEDVDLSGQVDLMLADDEPRKHRFSLRGGPISDEGGPAHEVLGLAMRLARSVQDVFTEANPFIQHLAPTNSFEVVFYAPDAEIKEAELRRREVGDEDPGAIGLPDTSLAVLALNSVFAQDEPQEAARAARSLGVTSAESILRLVATLGEADVELDVYNAAQEPIKVTPQQSIRIAEELDADAELPLETVEVVGVLQGVNSGGEGLFEIVTDADVSLSQVLGRRRKPGVTIKGELSPGAKRQIKEGSLWDTHVIAEVQVARRRRSGSTRVEGFRLLNVQRRFDD